MAAAVSALFPHARNAAPTFALAAKSYLDHGGEERYIPPIIGHFGSDRLLTEIAPFDIKQMAMVLYPDHCAATRNRQALTPARSVMLHGYERGWCPLIRLTRFKQEPPKRKSPASAAWLHLFTRQCDLDGLPHVAALVLFMAQTAARVSEAVRLEWKDVDLVGRRALLLRTKTDRNSVRHLTDELCGRLRVLAADRGPGDRVFRYASRYSVNERLEAVCQRAGISYKPSHSCGRHSFATNAMAMGADVKTAMEAGGWKSSAVFIETYVHSPNAGRLVADRFNALDFGGL
ncbi:Site-specific recombinase XerD [Devosia enhydra]|uniref:Site-specific recombinase XerD n=1 Tax=Devosia enhydra TaxID=665118 RepID=A0A1K2I118_9HYPH|nr:site-specific integrase [Devosia enhydra]SFZ86016.1 Site-specific recombinase XerD [Devosia enhydra]